MEDEGEVGEVPTLENDESYRRNLLLLFKTLRSQALSNREYFKDSKNPNDQRFTQTFTRLYDHLDVGIEPSVDELLKVVHRYDCDPKTPANGYRSFIKIIHKCCLHILQLSRHITVNRDSYIFRSRHYSLEIEAYVNVLGQLRACIYYLKKLVTFCKEDQLFGDEKMMCAPIFDILLKEVESLSQECFYGRCLGFQVSTCMLALKWF